ncbi:MAG: extracellular solute-binding protein [Thaumarchaeota archaeon]|nr:extracellular solute-binding protein [Nitrososphaerota archaeon]
MKSKMDEARKEGKVIIYGTVEKDEFSGWKRAFEEKFPFIDVDYRREYVYGTPPPMAKKIMQEMKEGKESADLVIATVPPIMQMQELGLLTNYKSPEALAYPSEILEREGLWTPIISVPIVQIYNSRLVDADELPRSASDLINPKWRNSLVIHDITLGTLGCYWLLSLKPIFGETKWREFAEGLARNKPKNFPLYDNIIDSVAGGDTKIGVTALLHDLVKAHDAERPIARLPVKDIPLLVSYSAIGMTTVAEHPKSAELLIDFLLSAEGQALIGNTYVRIPARPDVDSPYALNRIVPNEQPILFPNASVTSEIHETLPFVTKLFAQDG